MSRLHEVDRLLQRLHDYLHDVSETYVGSMDVDEWTADENERFLAQLDFYGRLIAEEEKKKTKGSESYRRVVDLIKQGLANANENALHLIAPLKESVSKLLQDLNQVDLQKLLHLLRQNKAAGDTVRGKDIFLFCGPTGAGKTTTLMYLAGCRFQEIEVDGFFHLAPNSHHDMFAGFETSYKQENTTQFLQTATISFEDKEIVLCDTPDFSSPQGVEDEIANGLGLMNAILGAKSVKPIVVLTNDGVDSRFSSFTKALPELSKYMVLGDETDLKSFSYVFTRHSKKLRYVLHRQFRKILRHPKTSERKTMVAAFLQDIIDKTTPEANIALPMEETPTSLLRTLVNDCDYVSNPTDLFQEYVSDESLDKLRHQLDKSILEIESALAGEDDDAAAEICKFLKKLARVLPLACKFSERAFHLLLQHLASVFYKINEDIYYNKVEETQSGLQDLQKWAKLFPRSTLIDDDLDSSLPSSTKLHDSMRHAIEEGIFAKAMPQLKGSLSNEDLVSEFAQLGFDTVREYVAEIFTKTTSAISSHQLQVTADSMKLLKGWAGLLPEGNEIVLQARQVLVDQCQNLRNKTTKAMSEDNSEGYKRDIVLLEKWTKLFSGIDGLAPIEINSMVLSHTEQLRARLIDGLTSQEFDSVKDLPSRIKKWAVSFQGEFKIGTAGYDIVMMHANELRDAIGKSLADRNYEEVRRICAKAERLRKSFPEVSIILENAYSDIKVGFSLLEEATLRATREEDYNSAITRAKEVRTIAGLLPEEGVYERFHLRFMENTKTIRDKMLVAMGNQDYDVAVLRINQIRSLADLDEEFAKQGIEDAKNYLSSLLNNAADEFRDEDGEMLAQTTRKLKKWAILIPETVDVSKKAINTANLFVDILREKMVNALDEHDVNQAKERMDQMHKFREEIPETSDICQRAADDVAKHLEMLSTCVKLALEQKDYDGARARMLQLIALKPDFPGTKEVAEKTLDATKGDLRLILDDGMAAMKNFEYEEAVASLTTLRMLMKPFPEASRLIRDFCECALSHLEAMRYKISAEIDQLCLVEDRNEYLEFLQSSKTELHCVLKSDILLAQCELNSLQQESMSEEQQDSTLDKIDNATDDTDNVEEKKSEAAAGVEPFSPSFGSTQQKGCRQNLDDSKTLESGENFCMKELERLAELMGQSIPEFHDIQKNEHYENVNDHAMSSSRSSWYDPAQTHIARDDQEAEKHQETSFLDPTTFSDGESCYESEEEKKQDTDMERDAPKKSKRRNKEKPNNRRHTKKSETLQMRLDENNEIALVNLLKLDRAAHEFRNLPGGVHLERKRKYHFEKFRSFLSLVTEKAEASIKNLPKGMSVFEKRLIILDLYILAFLKRSKFSFERGEVERVDLERKKMMLQAEKRVVQIAVKLIEVENEGILKYTEDYYPEIDIDIGGLARMRLAIEELSAKPQLCAFLYIGSDQLAEGQKAIKSLNRQLCHYLAMLAEYMEDSYADVRVKEQSLRKSNELTLDALADLKLDADELLLKLMEELKTFAIVRSWSHEISDSSEEDLNRLTEVKLDLKDFVSRCRHETKRLMKKPKKFDLACVTGSLFSC